MLEFKDRLKEIIADKKYSTINNHFNNIRFLKNGEIYGEKNSVQFLLSLTGDFTRWAKCTKKCLLSTP